MMNYPFYDPVSTKGRIALSVIGLFSMRKTAKHIFVVKKYKACQFNRKFN